MTTTTVTRAQVKALRTESAEGGDLAQVRICDAALELGEESSEWLECSRVIAAAAAMLTDEDA